MTLITLASLNYPRALSETYARLDSGGRPLVVGGTVLASDGFTPDTTNWQVERYEPSTDSWSVLAQANDWSAWAYADQSGNRILKAHQALVTPLAGGILGYPSSGAFGNTELYDSASNAWTVETIDTLEGNPVASTHDAKASGCCWSIGDALYITGGFLHSTQLFTTVSYSGGDGGSWSFRASAASFAAPDFAGFNIGSGSVHFQPYSNGAIVDSTGQVWLGPGCHFDSVVAQRFMFTYDPGADAFTRMSDAPLLSPPARIGSATSCISATDVIYCVCPSQGSGQYYTFSYDTRTDTWTRLADPPAAVQGAQMIAIRGIVYAFSSPIYGYDPNTDTWTATGDSLAANPAAHLYDGIGVYLLGGGSYATSLTSTDVQYWIAPGPVGEPQENWLPFGMSILPIGSQQLTANRSRSFAHIIGA